MSPVQKENCESSKFANEAIQIASRCNPEDNGRIVAVIEKNLKAIYGTTPDGKTHMGAIQIGMKNQTVVVNFSSTESPEASYQDKLDNTHVLRSMGLTEKVIALIEGITQQGVSARLAPHAEKNINR